MYTPKDTARRPRAPVHGHRGRPRPRATASLCLEEMPLLRGAPLQPDGVQCLSGCGLLDRRDTSSRRKH